jgi:hypothetical protein
MATNATIIDFMQHQKIAKSTVCRIIPENDGIEMLYSNDNSDQIFSLKVLCWALWDNGQVDGMVPWLNQIVPCRSLNDPLNGHWEGYLDPSTGHAIFEAPGYKSDFLKSSAHYYSKKLDHSTDVVQEIPDVIGTHAVFSQDQFETFTIQEIHSWRLYNDGSILGMAIDQDDVNSTPVLTGDECLFSAQHKKDFHYFFQHSIANKIKAKDPDARAAMAHLSKHSNLRM